MIEQWLPIPDWAGFYEVSDQGRVRSVDRVIETVKGVRHLRGVMLALVPVQNDYRIVVLSGNGVQERRYVHELVLTSFVGPRPEDLQARHWDDNGANNTLSNLLWGTPSENSYDYVRNGRHHNANKTRCKRGHLLVGSNLIKDKGVPDHWRRCRACHVATRRAQKIGATNVAELADMYYASYGVEEEAA